MNDSRGDAPESRIDERHVASRAGYIHRRHPQRTYQWTTDNSDDNVLISTHETTLGGLRSWSTVAGVTSESRTVYAGSGNRYVTNTAPDDSYIVAHYLNGRLMSVTRKTAANAQLSKTSYTYDAHGRTATVTDARNGATTYAYNNADQVVAVTTPAPGNGQSAQTTTTSYDHTLRGWKITYPDGASVTNEYHLTGELKRTYWQSYRHQGRR